MPGKCPSLLLCARGTDTQKSPSVLPLTLPKNILDHFGVCCWSESNDAYLDHARENHDFSVYTLAWAIQNGVGERCIERYLTQHNESENAEGPCQLRKLSSGTPILYFAAERNSPEIVRMLCRAGAKPSQNIGPYGSSIFQIPLLPYTIMSADYQLVDTTETVIALLAMGANPYQVPKDMWQDYLEVPTMNKPRQLETSDLHRTWCTTEVREALCRNFNLLQRYSLWKAAQIERPTVREIQVAKTHNIMPLFETPYHLFGQQLATTQVLRQITSRLLFNSQKPLVLLFTGLSGHGKTELARCLGGLLSWEMIVVDCTMMQHNTDMFGPWAPYSGSEVGSQLNNHLSEWDGKRTVVFLDHFDKTRDNVRQAMLLLFESGAYTDRRNNKRIDCSKVFWILAANIGIEEITKFWTDNLKHRSQEQKRQAPIRNLQMALETCVIRRFGASLAGRFSAIVPFLPFDEGERAITAYKFMRELWHDVRKPINTNGKHFAETLFVNFVNDGEIAKHIARRYLEETGARSLADAVEEEIRHKLAAEFVAQKGEVEYGINTQPLSKYDVRVVGGSSWNARIEVTCTGTKPFQGGPA